MYTFNESAVQRAAKSKLAIHLRRLRIDTPFLTSNGRDITGFHQQFASGTITSKIATFKHLSFAKAYQLRFNDDEVVLPENALGNGVYADVDCNEKADVNETLAVVIKIHCDSNPVGIVLDGPSARTSRTLLNGITTPSNILVIERDPNVVAAIEKLDLGVQVVASTTGQFFVEESHADVIQDLDFAYLDYMGTFKGDDKHLPPHERNYCPMHDIGVLMENLQPGRTFVLATTFCERGTKNASGKEYVATARIFKKYGVRVVQSNSDEGGYRYRRNGTGVPMHFTYYVLQKE